MRQIQLNVSVAYQTDSKRYILLTIFNIWKDINTTSNQIMASSTTDK